MTAHALRLLFLALLSLLSACASTGQHSDLASLQQQVMNTERAFARTMASRDHAAFTSFLSVETVFFSGATATRGKQQVAELWKRYFEAAEAPFSWAPEQVEVLDSGSLALSSGPIYDANGKLIATFTSIWRRERPGTWRIVFDKGNPVREQVL